MSWVAGTFAIFNHLVSFTNDRGRLQRPWFVEAWHLWGRVDARYRRSDPFIVVQVAAMALVAGPGCLVFAWATFERARPERTTRLLVFFERTTPTFERCKPSAGTALARPAPRGRSAWHPRRCRDSPTRPRDGSTPAGTVWRHALGLLISTAQIWTLVLYVSTAAYAGFRDCAPVDDWFYFWVLFVLTRVVTKPGRGDAAAMCPTDDPRRGRGVDAIKPTEIAAPE